MRIDKWLWAARFFKTRQLAVKAIKTGKIAIQGQTISKPAATINTGQLVSIKRGPYVTEIEILELNDQRGPAKRAALMYQESAASIQRRDKLQSQLKAQPKLEIDRRKPDKRGVREHRALKRSLD